MKITIDTAVDSQEDIRKVVALLSQLSKQEGQSQRRKFAQSLKEEEPVVASSVVVEKPVEIEPAVTQGFASMFSDPVVPEQQLSQVAQEPVDSGRAAMDMFTQAAASVEEQQARHSQGTAPNFGSFLNLVNKNQEEKKDEGLKIQFY